MMMWVCPACTYENPAAFNLCEICQTPAPVAAKQEEVYDVVEATDGADDEDSESLLEPHPMQLMDSAVMKMKERTNGP